MNRRDLIQTLGFGAAMGALKLGGAESGATAERYSKATKGLPPLKIKKVKAILTAPGRIRLCVVKVETSEPGLYGLGCATFNQRPLPVVGRGERVPRPRSPRAGTWMASRTCGRTPTPAPTGATARC